MAKKRHTVEQIIGKLREAEVQLAEGATVAEACRSPGVTEQTSYRWRKEYGGLKLDQARRLKDLERENARLRQAVADLTLDKLILKEAAEGNVSAPSAAGGVLCARERSSECRSDGPVMSWGRGARRSATRFRFATIRMF